MASFTSSEHLTLPEHWPFMCKSKLYLSLFPTRNLRTNSSRKNISHRWRLNRS